MAEFEHFKKINDELEQGQKEFIDCEIFYKRGIECQYMSITHPYYASQCAVLNLLTETCYRAHHVVMSEKSDVSFF